MNAAIIDRYRCPERFVTARLTAPLSNASRFFRFGDDVLCYGRTSSIPNTASLNGNLDLLDHVRIEGCQLRLPFDPTQVVDSLRYERYLPAVDGGLASLPKQLYYSIRSALPTSVRRRLQRIYLRDWKSIPFPRWPVDLTVDVLLERLLLLSMQAGHLDELPFIWFWPDGANSAAIVTHDVETAAGRDFCPRLMDIDESFGIRSSFQFVPEQRYTVTPALLDQIRARGHEINIQDLNHDGNLFRNRETFEARVRSINNHGREFGAQGFRSAVLYRNIAWYDQLDFQYDMSVPNIGHLEAQRGGCCTVFPYFIGNTLEIPVTTTQDYSLFYILRQYSLDLWKVQTASIAARHGLVSFIVHPDYVQEERPQDTYCSLLAFLRERRMEQGMWVTTPNEVNNWWRQRSRMALICRDGRWRIVGSGATRARIAYARVAGNRITYSVEE